MVLTKRLDIRKAEVALVLQSGREQVAEGGGGEAVAVGRRAKEGVHTCRDVQVKLLTSCRRDRGGRDCGCDHDQQEVRAKPRTGSRRYSEDRRRTGSRVEELPMPSCQPVICRRAHSHSGPG